MQERVFFLIGIARQVLLFWTPSQDMEILFHLFSHFLASFPVFIIIIMLLLLIIFSFYYWNETKECVLAFEHCFVE